MPPKMLLSLVHPDELKAWTADLHDRIAEVESATVIVPTGETALRALTGHNGIGRYRGSILEYRGKKVIPTYHPASCFRRPLNEKACVVDWRRIAEEAKTPEICLPQREHFTRPTIGDFKWFENEIVDRSEDGVLAIDCEWTKDTLLCVGFASTSDFSFTVPTTLEYWGDTKKLQMALTFVKSLCQSAIPKVLHHGHSDAYVLRWLHGIGLGAYVWDTLGMHHCLDPNSEHDLAYLASIYTRQPYWKDEAKDPEKIAKYATNFDALLTYNGMDVAVTRELWDVFYAELVKRGMLDFYIAHYAEMFDPIVDMMLQGIRVDGKKRVMRQAQLQAEIICIQDKISEAVGEQCFAKKSLKGPVMMRYFNETLGLPKVMRTRKRKTGEKVKTQSADEVAIRRWMLWHKEAQPVGQLVLDHRRKYSLMGFYS
jgi:hypothetical protein